MALTTNTQSNSAGITNMEVGQVVTDAAAAADTTFNTGFTPRYVQWVDRTTLTMLEWFEGMAANSAVRTVAAGTRTLDVAAGITVADPATGVRGFTIKAADIPVSSSFSWRAVG